jgi:diacylglycerol O-acyltransferase
VFPILPLAPGSPLAVGALSVTGRLGVGICAHPVSVPDIAAFEAAVLDVYCELRAAARPDLRLELTDQAS